MTDDRVETSSLPLVAAGRACGGRPSQQDDLICLHEPLRDAHLLVLADGMGGDGAGELASAGVIDVARQLWQQGQWCRQAGSLFLETLCQEAHAELRRRGVGLASGEPHATVVALLMIGTRLSWAHVGDSRLYRFRGGRCVGRTEDHSVAQLKVRRGELAHHALASDPDQHRLFRGLGGSQVPQVDHGCARLQPGESFALCSDGVWEQLSEAELARFAGRRDQRRALQQALSLALARGGEQGDNVALILARVGQWHGWWKRARTLQSTWFGSTARQNDDVAA